jgi:hypothetical protein
MSYETLGDLYNTQRLGSFDGLLGGVASAQGDYSNAQRELSAAQGSLQRVKADVIGTPVPCHAIPGTPMLPKQGCPTTSAAAQATLAAALRRVEDATNVVESAKAALDSEKSAVQTGEVMKGVGAIFAPLAQAGVGIFSAQQQANLEKARLKAQRGMPTTYIPAAAAKKSSLPLILGGLAAVGLVVGVVVMSKGNK